MDDRARVPFALVGVVLLVSSATLTATVQPRQPRPEPAVDRALDRAGAATDTALRGAIAAAARAAGREPVLERADTPTGRALNASDTFREYLRVRIYLAVRARLARLDVSVRNVRASATVPATPTAASLARAKRRVRVRSLDRGGQALEVRLENVTLVARREGRVLARERHSPTLVVPVPVLAIHDRVSAFERRLNAGPTRRGLGRRLTARLYAVGWARGYAQYGGGPIANVIANRHVALMTNGGILGVQRAVFGHSDVEGRRALARATARTAVSDVVVAAGGREAWVDAIFRATRRDGTPDIATLGGRDAAPNPEDRLRVGVNRTADAAAFDVVEGTLSSVLTAAYRAEVGLRATVSRRSGGTPPPPARPDGNWSLVSEATDTETSVTPTSPAAVGTRGRWHTLRRYGRRVVRVHRRTRTWRGPTGTRTTTTTGREVHRVTVALVGRPAPLSNGPDGAVTTAFRRGHSPLSGPNLADVGERAATRLVDGRGGPARLARRAVRGELDTSTTVLQGRRPDGLRRWIYRDLARLRERVRNVTVSVSRGSVGSFRSNPPAELAERVRARRSALLDAPARYASVAGRARTAARVAYLERVLERLEDRASRHSQLRGGVAEALDGVGGGSLDLLQRAQDAAGSPSAGAADGGPPGLTLDAGPPYLTLAPVDHERVPAVPPGEQIHPLVARNLNAFALPTGELLDGLLGGERVRLRTAARALRAANATVARTRDRRLTGHRDDLRAAVSRATASVRARLRQELREADVGADAAARRQIVAAGLEDWNTTADRAMAIANGSAPGAVTSAAAARVPSLAENDTRRDWLALRLRLATDRVLEDRGARVPRGVVADATDRIRDVGGTAPTGQDGTVEPSPAQTVARMPSGLPVAPVPGYWYATANVWYVVVRGQYERFALHTPQGRPTTPGARTAYVRDGSRVSVDVDGDGTPEHLGRAPRVSFETRTMVAVVVPSGGTGVGDDDPDERSPGWPSPGRGDG